MSTAQRLDTFLKMTLAGTTCAAALALATPAQAQLQYGDIVTVNTWPETSAGGRIYRHRPDGTRSEIGPDYGWTDRPQAVLVEDRNTLLVAFGNHHSGNYQTSKLYRVDVNSGVRTFVGNLGPSGNQNASWDFTPTDMERHPVTGQVFISTGFPYHTSAANARIWELNTSTAQLTPRSSNMSWNWATTQMTIDPATNRLYAVGSYVTGGPDGNHESKQYWVDLNNPNENLEHRGNRSWSEPHISVEWIDDRMWVGNGNMWMGWGDYGSRLGPTDTNPSNDNFDTSWTNSWSADQTPVRLAYDEMSNRLYMLQSNMTYTGRTSYLRYRDMATGQIHDLNNIGWDRSYYDLDVYTFGVADTGFNNVTIGGVTSDVTAGPNFRADDSDATLAVADLLTGLSSSSVSVRNGIAGDNNQQGNTTLAAALDYDGIDGRTLTLRASNDLTINAGATITDGDTGTSTETLNAALIANNGNAGSTGKLTVGAAVQLNGGTLTAEGKTVEFDAAVSAGATTVEATSAFIVDAPLTTTALTVTGGGDVDLNAATTTGSGAANITADDVTIDAALTTGNLTANVDSLTTTAAVTAQAINLTVANSATFGANLTGTSLTTAGAGSFDASAITLDIAGAITFGHSGTTRLATVNADALSFTSSQLITGAKANLQTLDIGGNTITIGAEADVSAATVNQAGGAITIAGGRYQGPLASYVTLLSGTLGVNGNLNVAPGQPILSVLGSNPVIEVGQELEVSGTTALSKVLTLDGGTLTTGAISSAHLLDFQAGTLDLTNSNLTVSSTGALGQRIELGEGRKLAVTGQGRTLTVAGGASGGIIALTGGELELSVANPQTQTAPVLVNNGTIELQSDGVATSVISGNGSITNNKTIKGTGLVMSASVNNATAGQVQVVGGDDLFFAGDFTNQGSVNFIGDTNGNRAIPATLRFEQTVNNVAGGRIEGSAGILRFANTEVDTDFGIAGLVNAGEVRITGDTTTDVFGTIFQRSTTGKVIISGGSLVNFYGDVFNGSGSEVRVAAGSAAVFLADFGGAGTVTGTGTKFFKGGILPGSSPGVLSIEGNVELAQTSTLFIELGGANPGSGYDQVNIGGQVILDGTLSVSLWGGYVPQLGDTFQVMNFGSALGEFDSIVGNGVQFDTTVTSTGVTLTVVPEPATAALALAGLALLARRRRAR